MNEAQTRFNKIDPKLRDAGWGIVPGRVHSGTDPTVHILICEDRAEIKKQKVWRSEIK
jgi:type I site-specific restriction endonuclease